MIIEGLRYKINKIEVRNFVLSNKGAMEALLKGNYSYPRTRNVTEYYITARRYDENFHRVLVLTKSEFDKLFPNMVDKEFPERKLPNQE